MIRIKIKTTNAAFENHKSHECARILRDLADQFDHGDALIPQRGDSIPLYDVNGNEAGECRG